MTRISAWTIAISACCGAALMPAALAQGFPPAPYDGKFGAAQDGATPQPGPNAPKDAAGPQGGPFGAPPAGGFGAPPQGSFGGFPQGGSGPAQGGFASPSQGGPAPGGFGGQNGQFGSPGGQFGSPGGQFGSPGGAFGPSGGQFGAGPQRPAGPDQGGLQQLSQAERQDFGVPVPSGLHAGAPHGPTPSTLPGGQVITTLGLVPLLGQSGLPVVVLDALGGTSHLPNAVPAAFASQPGTFNDQVQQQFAGLLAQATQGDRSRPVVVYCSDPHCWMSYNAALRAVSLGYRNVLWYRGGLWAWQQAGLPLQGG